MTIHADHAAMDKAVLLLDSIPMRQVNFSAAMLDARQGSPDQVHGALLLEAGMDAFGKMRVRNMAHDLSQDSSVMN
jgi:hypothetical protein